MHSLPPPVSSLSKCYTYKRVKFICKVTAQPNTEIQAAVVYDCRGCLNIFYASKTYRFHQSHCKTCFWRRSEITQCLDQSSARLQITVCPCTAVSVIGNTYWICMFSCTYGEKQLHSQNITCSRRSSEFHRNNRNKHTSRGPVMCTHQC